MTAVDERLAPAAAPPPRRPNRLRALLRNSWRQLTSMRTALVLLFLLAVAAIPGSVLPQRSVNAENVAGYFREHPDLAPVLDRLGGFEVYASPWFAAIYLLLFTSLIGCVVPRLRDHVRALRTVPPDAPRRMERLPQFAKAEERPDDPAAAAQAAAAVLRKRRFRTVVREGGGGITVSAEKGHLKETGNLLFHLALLAVLIGVGFGHWYGWHGNRLLVQGADQGFCNSVTQYDEWSLGPRVEAADLPFFCLRLNNFEAAFQASGQPKEFEASVEVQEKQDGAWRQARFTVNDPLRLSRANIHLLGHGYAVELRYTDRYGAQQTKIVPFLPRDGMFTSEGVAQFPDVNIDPKTNRREENLQVGFEGVYLPTVDPRGGPASIFPDEKDPVLFLSAYRGNLGLDAGLPGSVYALDRSQLVNGKLKQVSGERPQRLTPGQSWTLDDGTKLEFVGTRPFATLAVRADPTQSLVLGGAVLGLIGLMLSLAGHRRRLWFRITPRDGSGSLMEAGGLPRTDYPGFDEEFDQIVGAARGRSEGTP
ncbi:cytochrome c biogenesis protein ResB [Couchioplanes caeruleus]|uniref:Cytochrome C biogenesis protein ResB n=2 Tax=Couchioplanes caeruleus TaxID=56438 RepID=A0A1K0FRG0_9ACTN|nr:cytochrome c biogenesis protein ResB [Couchioplanes caeruleus]OJF15280.1 cytochrome C biogenesis protein ResB [Couchioplanes caeruleus subsp. caeruleus]ROP30800.1 cytochrome c biogenesis protein [Couchioplanes caeruleus]